MRLIITLVILFGLAIAFGLWLKHEEKRIEKMREDEGGVGTMVLIWAGLAVALIGGGLAVYFLVYATADVRGRVAVHNFVHGNKTYRISAYEHFYDLCAGVQSREASISDAQQEYPTATPDRKAQLNAVITANRNERADLITSYNADARKADTQANFLASDLPYQLSISAKETTCKAS